MTNLFRLFPAALFCVCFSVTGCKPNKPAPVIRETVPSVSTIQIPEKKLRIIDHGTVEFGKSFSFLQSPNMTEKEKERESRILEKSDPFLQLDPIHKNPAVDSLLPLLTRAGIVKDSGFRYHQFKGKEDTAFLFHTANGVAVNVSFINLEGKQPIATYNRLVISSGAEADTIETTVYFKPSCLIADVIPGGSKEIVLLNEDYMANHYFYYLTVYEIKTK